MKICTKCHEEKTIDDFWFKVKGRPERHSRCKKCRTAARKQYNKIPEVKYNTAKKARVKWLAKYGISVEEYDNMLLSQKGKCKICSRHATEFKIRLSVDHCHKTLKIRGLLCPNCNTALGKFMDDTKLLRKAINYLNV